MINKLTIKRLKRSSAVATLTLFMSSAMAACGNKTDVPEATTVAVDTTVAETEKEIVSETKIFPKEITGKIIDAATNIISIEDADGNIHKLSEIEGVDITKLTDGVKLDMEVTVDLNKSGEIVSIRPAGTDHEGETEAPEIKEEVTKDEVKQLQSGVKDVSDLSYDIQNAGAVSGVVIDISADNRTIIQTEEGPVEFSMGKNTDLSLVNGKVSPGDGVRIFFDKDGKAGSVDKADISINNPDSAVAAGRIILDVANDDFKSFAEKIQYPIIVDEKEYADASALLKDKDSIWTGELIKALVTTNLQKTAARDAGIFLGNPDGAYVLMNNDMEFKISGITAG
ncbi:hypothetical protein [Oribacterium sp. WCC10]|uniref:hypothetical protein n=1 Tax=Oribacterium sp. WCC10 TaxID=1855343 RepID=UPI0008DF2996|nr:hypothetical protein [Oribacterium sp. WCC10]SFG81439.1 hypothetical protein SAMN05216356_1353 [Oribacterium sp. WCC10]